MSQQINALFKRGPPSKERLLQKNSKHFFSFANDSTGWFKFESKRLTRSNVRQPDWKHLQDRVFDDNTLNLNLLEAKSFADLRRARHKQQEENENRLLKIPAKAFVSKTDQLRSSKQAQKLGQFSIEIQNKLLTAQHIAAKPTMTIMEFWKEKMKQGYIRTVQDNCSMEREIDLYYSQMSDKQLTQQSTVAQRGNTVRVPTRPTTFISVQFNTDKEAKDSLPSVPNSAQNRMVQKMMKSKSTKTLNKSIFRNELASAMEAQRLRLNVQSKFDELKQVCDTEINDCQGLQLQIARFKTEIDDTLQRESRKIRYRQWVIQ